MEKEKKMYALIAEQEQSGETVKAFAQKHGISYPTWYKWRKKYRLREEKLRLRPIASHSAQVQAPPTTNCIALGTSASPADAPIDVPDQIAANYQYDAAGNQISDASKNLTSVSWTVFGKVRRAEKTGAGFAEYRYDGLNNKTLIKVTDEDGTTHLRVVCFPYATRLFSPKKFA